MIYPPTICHLVIINFCFILCYSPYNYPKNSILGFLSAYDGKVLLDFLEVLLGFPEEGFLDHC